MQEILSKEVCPAFAAQVMNLFFPSAFSFPAVPGGACRAPDPPFNWFGWHGCVCCYYDCSFSSEGESSVSLSRLTPARTYKKTHLLCSAMLPCRQVELGLEPSVQWKEQFYNFGNCYSVHSAVEKVVTLEMALC